MAHQPHEDSRQRAHRLLQAQGRRPGTACSARAEHGLLLRAGISAGQDEALSLSNTGHAHAKRVRNLLDTARHACREQAFDPISEGKVGLEVTVHAAADQPPWDATNYLGCIADVLQDKSHDGPLDHLGKLASVWLYRNDLQLKEITYREAQSAQAAYTVTVRALTPPAADGSHPLGSIWPG